MKTRYTVPLHFFCFVLAPSPEWAYIFPPMQHYRIPLRYFGEELSEDHKSDGNWTAKRESSGAGNTRYTNEELGASQWTLPICSRCVLLIPWTSNPLKPYQHSVPLNLSSPGYFSPRCNSLFLQIKSDSWLTQFTNACGLLALKKNKKTLRTLLQCGRKSQSEADKG